MEISCEAGFDGGLEQEFEINLTFGPDPSNIARNKTSQTPFFRFSGLQHNKTFRITISSTNTKGTSDIVTLEAQTLAGQELDSDGPITRAAKNTELGGTQPKEPRTEDSESRSRGGGDMKQIASIMAGVVSALILVTIVIGVTMRIKCGRNQGTGTTWRKDNSESSFEVSGASPDHLVREVPGQ